MNIVIPHQSLQPRTLLGVIEEFITRQGAVHGHSETPLEKQIEQVKSQLNSGKALIVFDDETGRCSIFLARDWNRATSEERNDDPDAQTLKNQDE